MNGLDPTGAGRLRVVGYNVRDLLDDRDALAHVVRCCRPDVLSLQEAPRRPLTTRRTARLARETSLRHVAGGRDSGGTAVLVSPRLQVLAGEAARLPVAGWFTRTRGYALAGLALPGGAGFTAVSVHLPLRPAERVDHSRRVLARLAVLARPPYVVSADLNELPDGPSWSVFGSVLHDAAAPSDAAGATDGAVPADGSVPTADATFPARAPAHRIDGVLVSPGVRVLALRPAGAADGLTRDDLVAASDHLPLIADLDLSPGASPG